MHNEPLLVEAAKAVYPILLLRARSPAFFVECFWYRPAKSLRNTLEYLQIVELNLKLHKLTIDKHYNLVETTLTLDRVIHSSYAYPSVLETSGL